MLSLSQLLAAHAPLLVLDAASATIQVGWLERERSPGRWASSSDEAGVGLFRCIENLGVRPRDAAAFVFCSGPGSMLGVRTSAMAIRAWQVVAPRPVFSFQSLAVVAAQLAQTGRTGVTVIADARRETWHAMSVGSTLQRLSRAELCGELVTPENFRHWSALPAEVQRVPYALADSLPIVSDVPLFSADAEPDAFLHEEPSYATWTRQVHRAP